MATKTADRQAALLDEYRTLPAERRRQVAARAKPETRRKLMRVERDMAMDRSPGSLAAVLTEGREKQAPHLDLIDGAFRRIAAGERLQVMLTMPPRHGKALALDTPIPTPTGWTTMGELQKGDEVFDEQGQPCTVTWTSPTWYDRPCYDVVTDSGERIVADAEHDWWASLDRRRQDKLYTTRQLAGDRAKQAMIWAAGSLHLPEADLPIHPYVLGVWLGDGLSRDSAIVAVGDDGKFIRAEVENCGYLTADRKDPKCFSVVGFAPILRAQGLFGNKHIPPSYLRASRAQRLSLLQGLIDTDGHVAPDGQVEFCSIKLSLAQSAQELVRSLGGKASLITGDATIDGRFISKKYRVMFYLADVARLPRKAIRCRSGIRANRHYVMAMRRGPTATRCIEVDSASHLFLAGRSMIPTHNSQRASRWGPLWYLRRHPEHRVMIASYGADLADDHGRWVRDQLREYSSTLGIRLHPASHAANRFDLEQKRGSSVRGGMVTAGVGGGLTGKGFNLGIIDDPFKGHDDASSPAQRDRVWEWYRSVFFTRRAPKASMILINTRWHEDDLSGRLLAHEPHRWIQIDLPAIADRPDDPIGRPIGEPLWPQEYGAQELADTRESVGERIWYALYQQKPRPLEGGIWKWAWITNHRIDPRAWPGITPTRIIVAVDTAGGDVVRRDSVGNDEVGLICAARDADGHMYVLDDRSRNMGAETWGTETCQLAIDREADAIVIEKNFGGDMAAQIVRQAWSELERAGGTKGMLMPSIIEVHAKQGKRLRAEPIAQLYKQGLIHHVGEHTELEGQLITWIPGMDSPDRMDAAVHALTELADPAAATLGASKYGDSRLAGRR
ncbi:terminase large subunit domain-containing protein [Streptomyces sp. NPDC059076]|uniref:terminase large subunit domain-containing protein n=1 Tax=unclassified Streptomyces TaxID=2593676 RepID=UPI0036772814